MSRLDFTQDVSDEIGRLQAQSPGRGKDLFAQAHDRVFARWLAAGRQEALIRYLVDDFDGAEGGEEWMRRLADDLAAGNRPDLIRKLYEPVLARRRNHYFWRHDRLKPRPALPKVIGGLLDRLDGERTRLAAYKEAVLALMRGYRAHMAAAGSTELGRIDRDIDAFARGEKPKPRPAARTAGGTMDKGEFWRLVDAGRAGTETAIEVVGRLEAALAELPPEHIRRFDAILREHLDASYRWDLWAVAYAVCGGCGDDAFDYFRAWLVLQGRDTFEAAMADPVQWALQFPFDGDPQCEDLLGVAADAYRARTGEDMPVARRKRPKSPAGEAWSEATLAARFPALARRFDLG